MMYLNPFTGQPMQLPPGAPSRAMMMPVGPPGPRTAQVSFPPPPSAAPALAAVAAEPPPVPVPAAPPRQMGEPRPPRVGPLRWGLPQAIAQYIVDQGYKTVPGTGPGTPPPAAPELAAAAGDGALPVPTLPVDPNAGPNSVTDPGAMTVEQLRPPMPQAPAPSPPRPAPPVEGVHLANLPPPGMTPPSPAPRAPAVQIPDLIIPDRQVADTSASTAKRFGLSPAAAENLLAFGLQMAASGSKPGATVAGSLAEGGMAALKNRRDRKALDIETANKREEMDLKRATAINEARTQVATLMQKAEDTRLSREQQAENASALGEYRDALVAIQQTQAADRKERDAAMARIEALNAQARVDGDAAGMYEALAKAATMGGLTPLKPEDEQRIRATIADTLPDSSMAKGQKRQALATEAAAAVQQIQASALPDADKQARLAQVRARYQEQLKAIG